MGVSPVPILPPTCQVRSRKPRARLEPEGPHPSTGGPGNSLLGEWPVKCTTSASQGRGPRPLLLPFHPGQDQLPGRLAEPRGRGAPGNPAHAHRVLSTCLLPRLLLQNRRKQVCFWPSLHSGAPGTELKQTAHSHTTGSGRAGMRTRAAWLRGPRS